MARREPQGWDTGEHGERQCDNHKRSVATRAARKESRLIPRATSQESSSGGRFHEHDESAGGLHIMRTR